MRPREADEPGSLTFAIVIFPASDRQRKFVVDLPATHLGSRWRRIYDFEFFAVYLPSQLVVPAENLVWGPLLFPSAPVYASPR